jgi:molecular chaperone HscB
MRVVCISCDSRESGHWCSQCGAILPTPENEDYFSILGLPQKINMDEAILKERFFDLNRAFHPDRAAKLSDERMREIALRKSVLINNGFNTLRDRTRRIQYLIRQELGEREEKSGHVPVELFDLVEEINELMAEVHQAKQAKERAGKGLVPGNGDQLNDLISRLQGQLQGLTAHREAFERGLRSQEQEWDELCDRTHNFEVLDILARAKRRQIVSALAVKMDEISYVDSLIRRIKDTLYE